MDKYNAVDYRKTGSGKTYTVFGTEGSLAHLKSQKISKESGLVYRILHHMFDQIQKVKVFLI